MDEMFPAGIETQEASYANSGSAHPWPRRFLVFPGIWMVVLAGQMGVSGFPGFWIYGLV